MTTIQPPCPIHQHHQLDSFSCGVASLDHWVKTKAHKNESSRASRTYVICNDQSQVIGYYALATGSLSPAQAPGKVKRNMPNPIPVMILGRFAVDESYQGQGLGDALLRDAILRILQAADIAGIKAIVAHAMSEAAKQYYSERSFVESPTNPMTMILPLDSIQQI
jgi:predicted N-acetyltransferase YhbS